MKKRNNSGFSNVLVSLISFQRFKKIRMKNALVLTILLPCFVFAQNKNRWSESKANKWYAKQGWLVGCNYMPSTSINQLEMWQKDTFDTSTISKELNLAHSIGFNCVRVFLHHSVWQQDASSFKERISEYLSIAEKNSIKTIFVFFDDCWNATYKVGTQPQPKVGVHNSGWVRDPGDLLYNENSLKDTLETYVKDILNTFKKDKRIVIWDLYNEAGNSGYEDRSLPLLKSVFEWARSVNPTQPISSGVWSPNLKNLNTFILQNADVVTYHDYQDVDKHSITIDSLKKYGRPLVCTEYMARTKQSTFFKILPLLKADNIGAINWGFVAGKTNTIYAWDTPMPSGEEPKIWFHDLFRKDNSPFDPKEIQFIKDITQKK